MESIKINLGGALLGDELEFKENINIEIDTATKEIVHIGIGHDPNAKDYREYIALPPLVNSHTHTADYTFPEIGINKSLKELVGDPKSEKYKYFEIYKDRIAEGIRKFLLDSLRFGINTVVDFREQGVLGSLIARSIKNKVNNTINYIILGRLDFFNEEELDKLYAIVDGYGLPSLNSNSIEEIKSIKLRFKNKIRAAHVSETLKQYLLDDIKVLLEYYEPNLIIHGTHFKKSDFEILHAPVVFCPRSNLWHGIGIPRIADAIESNITILFGTDNGSWITPNLWKDLEIALLLTRVQKPMSDYSLEILKGATINAYKVFGLNYGIQEGKKGYFILLHAEEVLRAHNKYTAIIKRGSENGIYNLGATQNIS
ncbi:MAG: amidohydrolase family protein [Sulfolobaceae archaeon]|nr:amidohydrolase family protein [Stygiolobus sp.]